MGLLMLQILKWILVVIIAVLLILLGLLLLILFVPIRYRMEGEYHDGRPVVQGKAGWLLSAISLYYEYREEARTRIKVFGFSIYDSAKSDKKVRDKAEVSTLKAVSEETEPPPKPEVAVEETEALPKPEGIAEETEALPKPEAVTAKKKSREDTEPIAQPVEAPPQNKKIPLTEKIREIGKKIRSLGHNIKNIIHKIKSVWQKAKDKKALVEHYIELWHREDTQIAWQHTKKRVGRMLKSIAPMKWSVSGDVGFDDPSVTGKMMAGLGIAYPVIGGHVFINPNFEEPQMELKGFAKGRIILGVLTFQLIALICKKEFRTLLNILLKKKDTKQSKNHKNNRNDDGNENRKMEEVKDDRQ